MLAREAQLVAVDFESTGTVAGYPDEPWQIGIVPIVNGEPDISRAYETYIRVSIDRPFNPCAPGHWRDVRDRLARAPSLPDLIPELRGRIMECPLVAHNISTEKKFFRTHWPLHRPGPWIDTLKLARMAFPSLPTYELGEVIRHAGLVENVRKLVPDRGVHDALYDAAASAVLLCHMLRQPSWTTLTIQELARSR